MKLYSQIVIFTNWAYRVVSADICIVYIMLTCALRAHVKVFKNKNIVFNNTKNLMFKELNTLQVQ
jgi:hypothetical protein